MADEYKHHLDVRPSWIDALNALPVVPMSDGDVLAFVFSRSRFEDLHQAFIRNPLASYRGDKKFNCLWEGPS